MNDVKKTIYGTLIGFLALVLIWVGFVFYNSCGFSTSCPDGALAVVRTPIPTLIPATLPAADRFVSAPLVVNASSAEGTGITRPSNPGGPGPGVELTGKADVGKTVFDDRCAVCHGSEGVGGLLNPGSTDGTMPALNPVDVSLKDADYKTFAINLDLFLEHGSMPEGKNPIFQMPDWGDKGILTPQQIADLIAYIISLNP